MLEDFRQASEASDEGFNIDVIYLDFNKAFDKVSHKLLLHKLEGYGVNNRVLGWIK